MSTISIIGTGTMGTTIAGLFDGTDISVQTIGRSDSPDTIAGEVVVLAIPYSALPEVADTYRDRLAGKTVVDITNTLDFDTFEPLTIPAGSAAAELAEKLPDARVLKAFNTNFAAALGAKEVAGKRTTVIMAGDDENAKQELARVLRVAGLDSVDAGPLARARELEAAGYLQMVLAAREQIGWSDALGVIR